MQVGCGGEFDCRMFYRQIGMSQCASGHCAPQ
jgi:hypothetical protein